MTARLSENPYCVGNGGVIVSLLRREALQILVPGSPYALLGLAIVLTSLALFKVSGPLASTARVSIVVVLRFATLHWNAQTRAVVENFPKIIASATPCTYLPGLLSPLGRLGLCSQSVGAMRLRVGSRVRRGSVVELDDMAPGGAFMASPDCRLHGDIGPRDCGHSTKCGGDSTHDRGSCQSPRGNFDRAIVDIRLDPVE